MRDSGSSGAAGSGMCAACPGRSARSGCPRPGGCGSAGPARVPPDAKSYRVTMDRAGRWHVAFAVIPGPVPAPGNGQVVGIDRGVAVSAALSTGELLHCPRPDRAGADQAAAAAAQAGPRQAGLEPPRRGSGTRSPGCAPARPTGVRTGPRRSPPTSRGRFDVIRVEDLQIKNMTRSAKGTRDDPGPERPAEGRAEPGDPGFGVGAAGAPAGGQGPGPGGEGQAALHEPAVLGVRAGGPGLA